MRVITRLSQVIRGFSAQASKGTAPSAAPIDPLKNVVGELLKTLKTFLKNSEIIYTTVHNFLGLSGNCVKPNEAKSVTGTGNEYKVPEYFGYDRTSYHEAEIEMEKFRIPQPKAPRK